jgi:hypothetical protein
MFTLDFKLRAVISEMGFKFSLGKKWGLLTLLGLSTMSTTFTGVSNIIFNFFSLIFDEFLVF